MGQNQARPLFNGTFMSETDERERSNLSAIALNAIGKLDAERTAGKIKQGT